MTDQEEALALSEDQTVSGLIKKASAEYLSFLRQYQNGSLTWNQLQVNYTNIFTNLVTETKAQIGNSQTLIHAISNDYDSEHDTAFSLHIQLLLGLAEKNLGITAAQVFMPALPSTDLTYPSLIQGGDLPSSENWKLASGSGTLTNGQISTQDPNGSSFSQTIQVTPGHWYLISADINGANEGKDKYGNENVYSGSISTVNANTNFPQTSDELDEGGLHRRYF